MGVAQLSKNAAETGSLTAMDIRHLAQRSRAQALPPLRPRAGRAVMAVERAAGDLESLANPLGDGCVGRGRAGRIERA
jgi:hypothetical protein